MELYTGQTCRSNGRYNLVETCVHENAVLFDFAGQFFRNLANQLSLDLPRAWSKDESQGVGARFRRKPRILKTGVAANLDPHGRLSLAHGNAVRRSHKQGLERLTGLLLAHQRLADKKGMEARRAQPVEILGGLDPAFAHVNSGSGQAGSQIERDLKAYRKCAEVAV